MARNHNIQTPGAPATPIDQPAPGAVALAGIGDGSVMIALAGKSIPMNDIVTGAFESSGLNAAEWNDLAPAERDELVGLQRNEMESMLARASRMPDQEAAQAQAAQAAQARRQAHVNQVGRTVPESKPQYPHPDDLDPAKLSAPVMTSRGWMAPDPKGLPPNQLR